MHGIIIITIYAVSAMHAIKWNSNAIIVPPNDFLPSASFEHIKNGVLERALEANNSVTEIEEISFALSIFDNDQHIIMK